MKKLLLVCTGNTCRSPMAEGLLKHCLSQEGEEFSDIIVQSAGIAVPLSTPASSHAVEVLEEMGIDISTHASQMVTKQLLEEADLILTMTNTHKQVLLSAAPSCADKIFTLKEYVDIDSKNLDVGDPFGGNREIYRKSALEIKELIQKVMNKIK